MSSWQYKYFITVEPSTRAFVYINTGGKIETHFRNHDLFKISTKNLQNKGYVECLCTGMWHKLGPSLAYWTDYARVSQKKDCSRYSASYWPVSVEGSIFRRRRDVFPWHSMRIFCLIICIVLCWVKWLCQRRGVCSLPKHNQFPVTYHFSSDHWSLHYYVLQHSTRTVPDKM